MQEIKKVVVLKGEIINVGEMLEMPEGTVLEERKMEYSAEHGWREIDWQPSLSANEQIEQLKLENEQLAETLDMLLTEFIPSISGGETL